MFPKNTFRFVRLPLRNNGVFIIYINKYIDRLSGVRIDKSIRFTGFTLRADTHTGFFAWKEVTVYLLGPLKSKEVHSGHTGISHLIAEFSTWKYRHHLMGVETHGVVDSADELHCLRMTSGAQEGYPNVGLLDRVGGGSRVGAVGHIRR